MDAFSLAFSYGIKGIHLKKIVITAITVGLFHFFMPLLGNYLGVSLFSYTILKPKFIMFFVFFLLSLDMITHFFDDKEKIRKLDKTNAVAGIRTRVVGLEGPSNNQTIPQLHKCGVRDLNPGL